MVVSHLLKSPPKKNKFEKWIETGYALFSEEGPDGIQVERLARMLSLNKSGYYHYFGSHDNYMDALFSYHKKFAAQMAHEIPMCRNLDPDYFQLAVKYKACLLFQGQLLRRENNTSYYNVYQEVKEILDRPFLPLWSKFSHLSDNPEIAMKYFEMYRHSFHARVNSENMTYDYLHRMLMEAKEVAFKIFKKRERPQKLRRIMDAYV